MKDYAVLGFACLLFVWLFLRPGSREQVRWAIEEFWDNFRGGGPPSFPLTSSDSAMLHRRSSRREEERPGPPTKP